MSTNRHAFFVYARVSTSAQADDGVSLEDQEARGTSYVSAAGGDLLGVFRDPGVSGSIDPAERPGFREMVDAATLARSKVDRVSIVAVDLSRFSRDTSHTLRLVRDLDALGIGMISITESLDTKSPSGRMVVTMLAAMHQFNRENIAEKTRSALNHLRDTGRRYGEIPYGFRVTDGGFLKEDPAEQAVISWCRREFGVRPYLGGRRSVREVLERARDVGLVNPRTGVVVNGVFLRRMRTRISEGEAAGE